MARIVKCDIYNVLYIELKNFRKETTGWAIASVEDYELLSKYTYYQYTGLTKTYVRVTVDGREINMHELVMGKAPDGHVIDHINSNGLDNRRVNLRFATCSQNSQNKKKIKGKYSSDYTGVSKRDTGYSVSISHEHESVYIGRYKEEKEAAKAYDIYAIHYYGIHAKTNNLFTNK